MVVHHKASGSVVPDYLVGRPVNFFIPQITPRNPLREKLLEQATRSGYIPAGFKEMVPAYEEKFGMNKPLWRQYLTYMGDMTGFDLGYSISNYPRTVW